MKELIIKFSSSNLDAEVCEKDGDKIRYKVINNEDLVKKLTSMLTPVGYREPKKNIVLLNPQIIGLNSDHVVIKQSGANKIVNLSFPGLNQTYKIAMPNAIYIISYKDNKIKSIEAYSYKKFEGMGTELFSYPMPNELTSNNICMGNAPREIENENFVQALEKVIFTSYSHERFSGVNGFTKSAEWFEYLSKNPFPYKLLKPLKKKLSDVLHG